MPNTRDYSLHGEGRQRAIENGLASAQWYQTDVPRAEMKALMVRRDGPAIRDTLLWLALLLGCLAGTLYFWGSWWCVPFLLAYGMLYASACDARWHEMGHGTAFKTQWMNEAVYQLASFMSLRNPETWRWSHARHHTDTIIVGRDLEIALMRPPALIKWLANYLGIVDTFVSYKALLRAALGMLSEDEKDFIPEQRWPQVFVAARVHMAIHLVAVALSLYLWSWLPVLLISLPRIYGIWHATLVGLLQHGGLADNVLDHRLNCRTVYMNPVNRFIYMNMNYHVEHHMFPMVPFHALPRLHELIKHDLPVPNTSIWDGYREMIPVLLRQLRNEEYYLRRELPATARPYRVTPAPAE